MNNTYYIQLAFLLVIVAMFASFTAFDLAGRVAVLGKMNAKIWLLGSTLIVGVGVWAMIFLDLLASSNAATAAYGAPATPSFMLFGMGASGIALYLAFRLRGLKPARLVPVRAVSATIMGLAIVSMCLL